MSLIIVGVIIGVLVLAAGFWANKTFSSAMTTVNESSPESLYSLSANSLANEPVRLDKYQGQVALVVNTASKCGLTPQYEGLEKLFQDLSQGGFVILGFPSNDFLGQEPGTASEIASFCQNNYQITFPLFEKTKVKGTDLGPVYTLLTKNLEQPTWNFTKYLINKKGLVVARFGPRTKPDDSVLLKAISEELAK